MASERVRQILEGDVSFLAGVNATNSTGWLRHSETYLDGWLDDIDARPPRRFPRTVLIGMGGSSSPARFYADWRHEDFLEAIDTSNPDTVAEINFCEATLIASS